MLEKGWSPNLEIGDPVIWQRREFNQVADHLANYTMDIKSDWYRDFGPLEIHQNEVVNYLCHSDGGTRADNCSAAAWCIEAVVTNGVLQRTVPVSMRGLFLKDPVSSFLAESLALDDVLNHLWDLVLRRHQYHS